MAGAACFWNSMGGENAYFGRQSEEMKIVVARVARP
jgi:hypothetical protein